MDTTDEYIEMCKQLPKNMHSDIIDGDFYYWNFASQEEGRICISYTEIFEDYIVHHPEQWDYLNGREIIKLYRQDQLIEMNISASREKYNYANFDDFDIIKDIIEYADYTFKTLEKFLLNELMVTKYGKHWNGSEWDEI